jgi:hypothetical protein
MSAPTLTFIPFRFTIRRQIRLITNTPLRPTQEKTGYRWTYEPRSTTGAAATDYPEVAAAIVKILAESASALAGLKAKKMLSVRSADEPVPIRPYLIG